MKVFPPVQLQADPGAFDALQRGVKGFAIEGEASFITSVWLQGSDDRIWCVQADARDLQFMFEVAALSIQSLKTVHAHAAAARARPLPKELPEELRQLYATAPLPTPPARFEPWPWERWRCDVLQRSEFIIENVAVGPTVGRNPNLQSAAKPGSVPPEASAECEVTTGLLFRGQDGGSLLAAVGESPISIAWTRDQAKIAAYVRDCRVLSLDGYRKWLGSA